MVTEPTQVEKLVQLGLTSYEAKTYLALLRRESSTAAQAARLAKVPRQRVYDVLGSLVDKGLAASRPGPVVKYVAESPERALDRLVALQRERFEELERGTASLIETLGPTFHAGQEQDSSLEYIEVLRDRRAINERFNEVLAGIKEEILVFTKPPYATPPQEQQAGLEVTPKIDARSLYEYAVFEDPDAVAGIRRFIELGEKARVVQELPLKLAIVDECIVIFGMDDPVAGKPEQTMMVVEHPALASVLKTAFTALWKQGVPFDEAGVEAERRRRRIA
jgi:sugar-specific transcriptional regulator TrmB